MNEYQKSHKKVKSMLRLTTAQLNFCVITAHNPFIIEKENGSNMPFNV